MFIEGQVGHQAFQPRILVLERPELTDFGDAQVGVLLRPDVGTWLTDADLAADVRRRRAAFDLAEGIGDLPFAELNFDFFMRSVPLLGTAEAAIPLFSAAGVFGEDVKTTSLSVR